MLRLLQEQTFERVGGNETIGADVRLIAATHHDLPKDSAEGKFRPDLFYRLSVFTIHLPPLRERGDDLSLLVKHYLRRGSRDLGREVREIAPEAMAQLQACAWPGNIRELQSVLKQALLQARGTVLLTAFLPPLPGEVREQAPTAPPVSEDSSLDAFLQLCLSSDPGDQYAEAHRQLDRLFLVRVLNETGGNQQQAARRLGVGRETLRRRLRELGLHINRQLSIDDGDES
jgi:two-component system nitrogen regulation response regulator GlnG